MDSGRSPTPAGVGGSGRAEAPPSTGHTPSPDNPSVPHTTYNCSDNGSIDDIKKILTTAASKTPQDDPLRLISPFLLVCLEFFNKNFISINRDLKAIFDKLDTKTTASEHKINNQYIPQQPSWSTIAAGGLPGHPRLSRQSAALAAATATNATPLKSPPQHYQRELIAHCDKGAGALECSVPRLVEDLNRASKEGDAVGKLESLRKLQSGDVILRFDTTESRDSWKRCAKDWMKVFGVGAHLKERHYTVLIHSMKKSECQDSQNTIEELYRTNPRLEEAGIRMLRATFQKKTLNSDKSTGPLLITVSEPEHANEMVRQDIIWRFVGRPCELFEGNAKPTQCFKCYRFGHMAMHCRHAQRCGYCSRTGHKHEECAARDDIEAYKCANCKGNHAVWHRDCPTVIEQRTQSQIAFNNRPIRYRVVTSATGPPPARIAVTSATQELGISQSTAPPEGRPSQPRQRKRRNTTTDTPSNAAGNNTGEEMDLSQTQRLNSTSPRQMEVVQPPPASSEANKRLRRGSQWYTTTQEPNTAETTFAKTIEDARMGGTLGARKTRGGAASTMGSQSSDTCEGSDTLSTTPMPMEVDHS